MTQFFSEAIEEERNTRASVRLRDLGLAIVAVITLATMALVFRNIDRQAVYAKVAKGQHFDPPVASGIAQLARYCKRNAPD